MNKTLAEVVKIAIEEMLKQTAYEIPFRVTCVEGGENDFEIRIAYDDPDEGDGVEQWVQDVMNAANVDYAKMVYESIVEQGFLDSEAAELFGWWAVGDDKVLRQNWSQAEADGYVIERICGVWYVNDVEE